MTDRVGGFGGAGTFTTIFLSSQPVRIILNTIPLWRASGAFDPYLYILLNLVPLTVAAVQAPIILMSQNRRGPGTALLPTSMMRSRPRSRRWITF